MLHHFLHVQYMFKKLQLNTVFQTLTFLLTVQICLLSAVSNLKISFCAPSVWMCSLILSAHHVDTTSAKTASLNTGRLVTGSCVQCVKKPLLQDLI